MEKSTEVNRKPRLFSSLQGRRVFKKGDHFWGTHTKYYSTKNI